MLCKGWFCNFFVLYALIFVYPLVLLQIFEYLKYNLRIHWSGSFLLVCCKDCVCFLHGSPGAVPAVTVAQLPFLGTVAYKCFG